MGYLSVPVRQHLAISGLVKDFIINLYCVSKWIQLSKKKERGKKKRKQLRPHYKQWSPQAGGCSELYGAYFPQPQLDWNNLLDVSIERQRLWVTDGSAMSALFPATLQTLGSPIEERSPLRFILLVGEKWCNASDPEGKSSLQIRYWAYCWNYCMGYFWFIQRSVPFCEQGAIRYSPGQTKR